jgi:hypothetical protein
MRSLSWTGALALLVAAIACGSSGDGSQFGSSGGTSGNGGPGGTGTSGWIGGSSSGDLGDGGPGSSGGPGGNCSGQVDMFIMFDRSFSMGADCNIGDTKTDSKWCHAMNALSGYFNSQGATGQAAALQYFPIKTHTDALCKTGTGYDVAAVPDATTEFQTLPSPAFDVILDAESPGSGLGTPTEAAIRGISTFTTNHRRGGRVTIGILITDGDPNGGCDNDFADLAKLLDDHYKATQSRTYVIGMDGAVFKNLETIAAGGNAPTHPDTVGAVTHSCGSGATPPCRSWNVGNGDPAVFTAALAAIQASADGCKEGGGFINPVK